MAKLPHDPHTPARPKQKLARDPAKHSQKDPARPTRAKAARPEQPPTEPALADLLNPGIGQGTAGPGSQTGLKPPPDNSFDRRADFAAAHRARKSTPQGLGEAPQAPYRGAERLGELDPDLAKALGLDDEHGTPAQTESDAGEPVARASRSPAFRGMTGAAATVRALETLLREGRPEFSTRPWTPHRPARPEKSEGGQRLVVKSDFSPKGDQPQAIADLVEGVARHDRTQVLLGVTGSGKTFTMAKVIEATQRPAIILAPNKTLAAQLYGEFKSFFPDNAVEYFVSYYDYYQPEAYIPRTDTYIEKDSSINELEFVKIYANSHYVTPRPTLIQAIQGIKAELKWRLDQLHGSGRLLEAQRLEQRTLFDLEMMDATGACAGIENYSRYLTGRKPGEPPPTLFEYVPDNALVFVDESHVTVPQIGGMYRGDFRRKATLAEYGFRLPSCMDNRPLRFEEWDAMRPQTTCVSATPGSWDLDQANGVFVEQVIRPTGLIDPPVDSRPARTQVDDLVGEVRQVAQQGYRALVTVLTKRMAEDLTEYLHEQGIRVRYMHSDIDTIERIEIIRDLRLGAFDALVGINLLREGLDIPECALVAILDADKEGFLRSETSLIQTIGRAARNVDGRVILYADSVTGSMERAIAETNRRREKQVEDNTANGITPESIKRSIHDIMNSVYERDHVLVSTEGGLAGFAEEGATIGHNFEAGIRHLETRLREAAAQLDVQG